MAESGVTKRSIARAMKELMEQQDFSKISVGDICQCCGMNRKSFYYHFRDKYDLVNWIFQTEFLLTLQQETLEGDWALVEALCRYFYDNRLFYRRAFSIQGQNSFRDYFREFLEPVFHAYAMERFQGEHRDFFVQFYADAFIGALVRWLSGRDPMPPERFTGLLARILPSGPSGWEKQGR